MMIIISINHFFYALLVVQYDLCWMSFPIKKKMDYTWGIWFDLSCLIQSYHDDDDNSKIWDKDIVFWWLQNIRSSVSSIKFSFFFWMEKIKIGWKRWINEKMKLDPWWLKEKKFDSFFSIVCWSCFNNNKKHWENQDKNQDSNFTFIDVRTKKFWNESFFLRKKTEIKQIDKQNHIW